MKIRASIFLVLFCWLMVVAGCENSIDPIDREKGLYSVYGSLDVDKNVNYIRVKELNTPLHPDSTKQIDADVKLTNLNSGNTETLQDTVVQFDDISTHNFYTSMNIAPETDYELTVERSDGRIARAVAKTPQIASTQVAPQQETCYTSIELSLQPVAEQEEMTVEVGFEADNKRYWTSISLEEDEQSPDRLYAQFSPKQILNRVFNPNSPNETGICCFQLSSEYLYIRYTHYGPDFQQGTIDSVAIESGTGTFGGYYERTLPVSIDTSRVRDSPSCLAD